MERVSGFRTHARARPHACGGQFAARFAPDSHWIRARFRRIEGKSPKLPKADSRESGGDSRKSPPVRARFSRIRPDSRELGPYQKVIVEKRGGVAPAALLENHHYQHPRRASLRDLVFRFFFKSTCYSSRTKLWAHVFLYRQGQFPPMLKLALSKLLGSEFLSCCVRVAEPRGQHPPAVDCGSANDYVYEKEAKLPHSHAMCPNKQQVRSLQLVFLTRCG